MRATDTLIAQNNEKRAGLTKDNMKMYEDLLLYVRTDLRVDEQAGEEVLMDILDHLLDAQENGRTAEHVLGNHPQEFADELIEQLPSEKKRNVTLFVLSQLAGLLGWFAVTYGVLQLIIGFFTEQPMEISLGSIAMILLTSVVCTIVGVVTLFKIMRSSLFKTKKKARIQYWKAGLLGAALFSAILVVVLYIPQFGPVVSLPWWMFVTTALVLFVIAKLLGKRAK